MSVVRRAIAQATGFFRAHGRVVGADALTRALMLWSETPYVLTRDGALLAFVEFDGRDPDGFTSDALTAATLHYRHAYDALPSGTTIYEYTWHALSAFPKPRLRSHRVVDAVQGERYAHQARLPHYRTRHLSVIALPVEGLAAAPDWLTFATTLMLATVDQRARRAIVDQLSPSHHYRVVRSAVDEAARTLRDVVDTFVSRLSLHHHAEPCGRDRVWTWSRALAGLDATAFDDERSAPSDGWAHSLLDGRIVPVSVDGLDYLKAEGQGVYARYASVVRYVQSVTPALWCAGRPPLIATPGNWFTAVRSTVLRPLAKEQRFGNVRDDLQRSEIKVSKILSPNSAPSQADEAEQDQRKKHYDQLALAQDSDEQWFDTHAAICLFGHDTVSLRNACAYVNHATANASVNVVWETPAALHVHAAMQPGGQPFEHRIIPLNTTQRAAVAPRYGYTQGVERVADLKGDEPLIWFETADGQPFGFSPFVGERASMIATGQQRSGKTLLKNLMAAAWPKYGGSVVAIDYDPGSECLARLYGDDGALFATDRLGMNPFATDTSAPGFSSHISRLVSAMLTANDDPGMRALAENEQHHYDAALERTLALPPHLRSLSSFAEYLPRSVARKLSRWLRGGEGRYSAYLDADYSADLVGRIARTITAFNLRALRDDPTGRMAVVLEILHRVTEAFEDLQRRDRPDLLVIDEAHLVTRDPQISAYLPPKARTWPKYKSSMMLLSQFAEEYQQMPDWDAMRGCASTFLFTSVGEMNRDTFRNTFPFLTTGDLDAIAALQPKRDVYLVQPEIQLRKRLVVTLDPFARVWSTSTADSALERDRLIQKIGFDAAVQQLVRQQESVP